MVMLQRAKGGKTNKDKLCEGRRENEETRITREKVEA